MEMKRWMLIATLVLLIAGNSVSAQPPEAPPPGNAENIPPGPPPQLVEENRDMMQQVMVSRLTRDLGLNDEQSLLVMRRFGELGEQQRELRRKRMAVIQKLRPVLKQQQNEDALKQLMKELEGIKRESAASEQTLRKAFEDMNLDIWQKAKVELFLNDFESQMRRIVQQAQGRRPGMADPRHGRPGPPHAESNAPLHRPRRPNAPQEPPPPPPGADEPPQ